MRAVKFRRRPILPRAAGRKGMENYEQTREMATPSCPQRQLITAVGRSICSWASFMRFPALPFILCLALPAPASADSVSEFEAARERWRTADVKSYSFIYEWAGGVVVAPKCADAKIRVVVRNGVSAPPIVARGSARCPRGTHGAKAIGFAIPDNIDSAFAEMAGTSTTHLHRHASSPNMTRHWAFR